ncbi:DUF4190 domain-containing protein [Aciduricibacillus chroicocephali]|uniref:DUF4190 domain-containing protein n=1 Tax=Aciduricibacillus chroicocephali TaxID=3054939 RepID=A0ABY9KS51_9BACI|nr:DUF4190 domain-containing protein [Bacillaceae bacterium 44XB]
MDTEKNRETNQTKVPDDEFRFHEPYKSLDERNEEIAGELTADDVTAPVSHNEQQTEMDAKDADEHHGFGWFAVALSILSFFLLPVILGAAGIILGIMARQRNARTLGNIAIIVGIISILGRMFVLPFS